MELSLGSCIAAALRLSTLAVIVTTSAAQQAPTTEQAKLTASDGAGNDEFGASIAVDGDTVLVGAPFDDDGAFDAGTAFVYVRSGNSWSEQQKLVGSQAGSCNVAGTSVALDGDTAVVGAPQPYGADGPYYYGSEGLAFVYTRSYGYWNEQTTLTASDQQSGDEFGQTVALDGSRIAVGAPGEDGDPYTYYYGFNRGAVYVFDDSGYGWSETVKLIPNYGNDGDRFGEVVAMEGNRLVVSAPNESGQGAVYVFDYDGYNWNETQMLSGSDTTTSDRFGSAVAVSGDTILVGARNHNSGEGAAYVFTWDGYTWTEEEKLVPAVDNTGLQRWFGDSCAIDTDTAVIGARLDGSGGAAYIFERSGGYWSGPTRIESSDIAADDRFGSSVAYDGTSVAVGARADDDNGSLSGSAYVFVAPPAGNTDIIAMDADGDGDLDVLTTRATGAVQRRLNDGSGVFAAPTSIALTASDVLPVALVAGDFDNDPGTADIAVACETSNTIVVITDLGGYENVVSSNVGSNGEVSCIAAGDFDGYDPTDDIVYGLRNDPFGYGGGLGYLDNANCPNNIALPMGVANSVVAVAVADLDGDGDDDVVALAQDASDDRVLLIENDGATPLLYSSSFSLGVTGSARGLCVTDVDRDGDLDILVAVTALFPTPSTELRCLLYSGSGVFGDDEYSAGAGLTTGGTFVVDIDTGDVDCNGAPGVGDATDVVLTAVGSGDVELLIGYDPTVPSANSTQSVNAPANAIASVVADLNGDNVDDIVVVSQSSTDLEVTLNSAPCDAVIGIGCPGTGGIVPTLAAIDTAYPGNTAFGAALRDARPFAPAVFLISFAQTDIPLPMSSCSLYLDGSLATVARFCDAFGSYDYVFGVPSTTPVGLEVYFQYAVFDPNGSFASRIAMTNALRIAVRGSGGP